MKQRLLDFHTMPWLISATITNLLGIALEVVTTFDSFGALLSGISVCILIAIVPVSYLQYREAAKRADIALADLQRHAEVQYFEWLHDASPDD